MGLRAQRNPGSLADTIGNINPIRYCSYYYDTDTGFYYLQSRYYDPTIKRFINPDDVSLLGANGDFASLNLYAYCGNNPVARADEGGEFWNIVTGAIIGGTISLVSSYLAEKAKGDDFSFGEALAAVATGAISGALTSSGLPVEVITFINSATSLKVYSTRRKTDKTAQFIKKAAVATAKFLKTAPKAIAAAIKTAVVGTKAIVAAIVAGGWIAVVIIVVLVVFMGVIGAVS